MPLALWCSHIQLWCCFLQPILVESDTWLKCASSWSAPSGSLRYWWCLYYHNRLEWAHHIQHVYLSKFVSSIEPMYMLLLQYTLLRLYIRILMIVSCLDMILNTHPSRTLLHWCFIGHQYNLPNLHLCRQ